MECVNADRKQLVGVLSHEVRNRLDILTNLIARASVHEHSSGGAGGAGGGAGGGGATAEAATAGVGAPVVLQSIQLQQSVSVVLDLLDIESLPRPGGPHAAGGYAAAPATSPPEPSPPSPSLPVRLHLGLVVHSAQQLQVQALRHVPAGGHRHASPPRATANRRANRRAIATPPPRDRHVTARDRQVTATRPTRDRHAADTRHRCSEHGRALQRAHRPIHLG